MTATAATLTTMVAIPATSMMETRLGSNAIRHRWLHPADREAGEV